MNILGTTTNSGLVCGQVQPVVGPVPFFSSDTTTMGGAAATVDLQYFTTYLTAQGIEYVPAFTLDQTGTIDDRQGLVRAIGGRTDRSDVGDDVYVLLARVHFASTGDDQVPVDQVEGNIGPYNMKLALADGQTRLVGVRERAEPKAPSLGRRPVVGRWTVRPAASNATSGWCGLAIAGNRWRTL